MANLFLYIDPNAGSYLFQILIAGIVAAIFYFKKIITSFKGFLGKARNRIFGNEE
jgi:hypothetical protein